MAIQGIQAQLASQMHYSSQGSSAPKSEAAEAVPDKAAEVCIASTDKVDGEIARLKEKESMVAQQLRSSGDPARQDELEEELSRIEAELRQKDNDTYRRQNTEFSSGIDVNA